MKMGFITSYTGKSHLTRDILWLTWPKRHELLMSVLIKVTLHYQKRRCGRAIHNGHIELIFLQWFIFFLGESPPRQLKDCPEYWVAYENSCYRFFQHSRSIPAKSWEDSRAYCRVLGGDLVSIGTQGESKFLEGQLSSYGQTAFWLGLYRNTSGDVADEGWIWMDGTPLIYKKWAWNEPNNFKNGEQCGEIYANTGYWNDNRCSEPRSVICENQKGKYCFMSW